MKKTISFLKYDVKLLRNTIIKIIKHKQDHKLFNLSKEVNLILGRNLLTKEYEFLYQYFKLLSYAELVALSNFEGGQINRKCIIQLINHDLKRATLPIALAAWLTTDNYKLPTVNNIPTDLNYGLVLQYPEFIIPYALFVLKINSEELLNNVDQYLLKQKDFNAKLRAVQLSTKK